jgi:hypothetical protein
MHDLYVLTAFPTLLPEGEHEEHLEYVTFIATNGEERHKYGSVNNGTYATDFAKFVTRQEAEAILARLRKGEMVIFPGLWSLDEVRHCLGFSRND